MRTLTEAVYSLEDAAGWPGRDLEWSAAQIDIFLSDETDRLASYAGVVVREGRVDHRPVVIGGVGGVKTHPDARGKGYAAVVMTEAALFWADRRVDFGLLVCEPGLIDYYSRLGWSEFSGTLMTLQKGRLEPFEFNRVMVRDVASRAPVVGTIDLAGPPW